MIDETNAWVLLKRTNNRFQLSWSPPIVGIEKAHVVASAGSHAGVDGAGLPAVFLKDNANTRLVLFKHSARVVGRSVVNNDDLRATATMRQNTIECCPNKGAIIIVVDDYADLDLMHYQPARSLYRILGAI
jgi:hypothetical protein